MRERGAVSGQLPRTGVTRWWGGVWPPQASPPLLTPALLSGLPARQPHGPPAVPVPPLPQGLRTRRSSGRAPSPRTARCPQRRSPTRPSLLTGVCPAQATITASHTFLPCSCHDWCFCRVSTTLSFIYVSGSLHAPWLGTGGRPPPMGAPRFCSSMPARLSLSGGGRPLAEGARGIILQDQHSARDRRASR